MLYHFMTLSYMYNSEIEDCSQDWTYPPDSFDYVHLRYLVGCIPDWDKLFQEAYKVLKPGGWIETFEASPTIESDDGTVKPDSAMAQWAPIFIEASKKIGNTFTVIADDIQRSGIEKAGFTDVKQWDSKVSSRRQLYQKQTNTILSKATPEPVSQRPQAQRDRSVWRAF
jgi:SAM-dependent methyltransferase